MSAAFIEIPISGAEAFDIFKRLPDLSSRAQPMLDEIGAYLDSDVSERFIQGVTPEGRAWTPSQRAVAEGGKTLIDSAILMSGVTHNADNDSLIHGLTDIYAAIHHFGGKAGRGNKVTIEARPIIGIATKQQAAIERITTNWISTWFPN